MEPIDEGRKIPGKKSGARNLKKRSTNSKESVDTDQEIKKQKFEVNLFRKEKKQQQQIEIIFIF